MKVDKHYRKKKLINNTSVCLCVLACVWYCPKKATDHPVTPNVYTKKTETHTLVLEKELKERDARTYMEEGKT